VQSVLPGLELAVTGQLEAGLVTDGRWAVTMHPDLTVLPSIEPDNAQTRLRYLAGRFNEGVTWTSRDGERQGTWAWPPDFWSKRAGQDDVLLHPAIQAVLIFVSAREKAS
jgi:hypothetical protein